MGKRLKDKVAVVTGSGQGIGLAIAMAFAGEGAAVITNNRSKGTSGGDAETAAKQIISTGGEAKRMVKQGGVSVDGDKVTDPQAEITPIDGMIVQVGKRKFAKLIVK